MDIGFTFFTIACQQLGIVKIFTQAVCTRVNKENNVSSVTSISTVRTSFGAKLTTVEVGGTITAFTGAGINFELIYKHGQFI